MSSLTHEADLGGSTRRPLIIIGAGGFGREVLDVVEAINRALGLASYQVLGVIDSDPSSRNLSLLANRGIEYLGTEDTMPRVNGRGQYVVAVGDPKVRQKVVDRLRGTGWKPATLIHPTAVVGSQCQIGFGTVICGGTAVSTNVSIGQHVHINANATIGHDSRIDSYVSVNPAATISGNVHLATRVLVGAGATVLQELSIGRESLVGAGAVVTKHVYPDQTVSGVPARPMPR